jgi:micrococcal nuclease
MPGSMARYRKRSNLYPFRPRYSRRTGPGFGTILFVAPLAAFTAVFLWDWPPTAALDLGSRDRESARFTRCEGPVRVNCVVDGDTLWYRGEKIRLSDINAPEVSEPGCSREARLGEAATRRLQSLLNAGPFTLHQSGRDRDRYDRLLREVTRGGESLGEVLVEEGVAERWRGYRGDWC